jgi:hypothetical protein
MIYLLDILALQEFAWLAMTPEEPSISRKGVLPLKGEIFTSSMFADGFIC